MTDSKGMAGVVRGFHRGTDEIRGHANLVAVEAQKGTAAAAMGVASMVVGQYYMIQMNAELGQISDGISKISDFQDNEYRSRVFGLVAHVKTIASFQADKLYVQVTKEIKSEETEKREYDRLLEIHDNYPKYVLMMDDFAGGNYKGIKTMHIADFLLSSEF
ncbi:MAG: hypothetical protein PHY23_01515 [Oscillospiraceae bacterium]|nr:hypothetical protein [Oscillospiraceae bacterium]